MKITVLVENTTTHDNIETEHGLSLYIEANDQKILFDAGQSSMFARNAQKLDIDLSQVDMCVLSHGHYDHGGGLRTFLEINDKAKIYMNEYAFDAHYNGTEKYIGLDKELLNRVERIVMVGDKLELEEGLKLYSCNDKTRKNNLRNPSLLGGLGLTVLENGEFKDEDFRHEQYLLIEEGNKKVLISGCSHKGIVDIVNWFNPDVLVGGFHFMKLSSDKDKDVLMDAGSKLMEHKTMYYTCHCTGCEQYEFLKDIMNEQLEYVGAGKTIEI
ncbi:MAG: MBL fold metallo-hydrolase [Lachnospiraceae bacterium]|nr:MBL fold metallo-hydrolase [Lachnospiraceae bacterium]